MAKISKKRKAALGKFNFSLPYGIADATKMIKEVSYTKFDSTVEASFNLNVDPKKSDQMIRGTVSLPHGTGKSLKILVICNPQDVAGCLEAGANFAGLDEYIEKIKKGWTDVDIIITHPSLMGKLGPLGKALGPKGLMPNPKSGTVTTDVVKAVKEFKAGKIDFRVDKQGIINVIIGKVSFEADKLAENFKEIYQYIVKAKPSSTKGNFIKGVYISSTMSPSVTIDENSI